MNMKFSILNWLIVSLPLAAGAGPAVFSNTAGVTINSNANPPALATPYPSTIAVTGLSGQVISKATVTLQGFTHTFPSDVSILLVSPGGQRALLMAEAGGQNKLSVTNLTLTLDDEATNSLPLFTNLVSGTFKPTNGWLDPYFSDPSGFLPYDFPPPAPVGSSNSVAALSVFNSTNPNGAWSLFVLGESAPDSGVISNGWSLAISAEPVLLSIALDQTNVVLSWTNAITGFTLQTTPSLQPPVMWTNALPLPATVSGRYTVTNPIIGSGQIYRLKM
jgi:subtilisin-like proprotein convertase family protein